MKRIEKENYCKNETINPSEALFCEYGYQKTSLRDIARKVGITQAAIKSMTAYWLLLWICFFWAFSFSPCLAKKAVSEDLFGVSFPTASQGWACGRGGTILHSTDGGLTWAAQRSGSILTLSAIHFVNAKSGWAVGDAGIILHTADGGNTWIKQKSPVRFFLMDVYFKTPQQGWIVTEGTHILFTRDGGTTWQIQFKDRDFILKAVDFADERHGWAVGEYGFIYHTENGGDTWDKQAGHFYLSEETGEVEGGIFLFDVFAISRQEAWAVGIDGQIIKTTDGGKLWSRGSTGIPKTQLFCIEPSNKARMLIGGNGVFLSSADSGKTWHKEALHPPITYGWIYAIAASSSSRYVAVGREGAIYVAASGAWEKAERL